MPADYTLYYNPRCSTCRRARQLLLDAGLVESPNETSTDTTAPHQTMSLVEYLKADLDVPALTHLVKQLNTPAHDMLRQKESVYKELALQDHIDNDAHLIQAVVDHPVLLERPILIDHQNDRAIVGRPPERLLELL